MEQLIPSVQVSIISASVPILGKYLGDGGSYHFDLGMERMDTVLKFLQICCLAKCDAFNRDMELGTVDHGYVHMK